MRMRLSVALIVLSLSAGGFAQTSTYGIYFNGVRTGSETFTAMPDGSATGECSFTIGSVSLKEKFSQVMKSGKIVSLDNVLESPGGAAHYQFDGSTITATGPGGTKKIPYQIKSVITGNFMVPLWANVFGLVQKGLASDPKQVTLDCFLADAMAQGSATFRPRPDRVYKGMAATSYRLNLASIEAEIDFDAKGQVIAFDVPIQKLRFVRDDWAGMFTDPLSQYPELSQPTLTTVTDKAVTMKTRDGVALVSTVIRPSAPGKYPVILERTPYGRAGVADGELFASRGYVVVAQDVRGRGDSSGEWDPFVHEGDDGFDAIAWCAAQPWSSGRVGMIGGSYGGYVQWAAAVKSPPALKCIVPQVSPPDAMHNLPHDFGVPFLYGDLWWGRVVQSRTIDAGALTAAFAHPQELAHLPLSSVDMALTGTKIPFWQKWVHRTTEGDWKGFDFLQHLQDANVPALQISGWLDGDGIGTKLIWSKERELGRHNQWLIEGPWSHAFNTTKVIGQVDFGDSATIDLNTLYLRWFDTWLKKKSVNMDAVPHAQIFVTGANQWRMLPDWPYGAESRKTLFLAPGASGKWGLSPQPPGAAVDSYDYDPATDTDTSALSGKRDPSSYDGIVHLKGTKSGGYHLYETAPFEAPEIIAGPSALNLSFTTSAQDTDFFVTVVEVDAAEKLHMLGLPGKLRASYREGMDKQIPLRPNQTYTVKVLPWDFAHEFRPGTRLGIVISSSGFPAYARNLGTVEPIASATKMVVQHNKILMGGAHPSSFSFYVLPLKP